MELQGYDPEMISQGMIEPNPDDHERILIDLKEYYGELIQVVQKRYDEVKVILETYFRQLISIKREELDSKHQSEELTEEDFQNEASTFAQIADQHNEKLIRLREGFEEFSTMIDEKFDDIVVRINQLYAQEQQYDQH